LELGQLGFIIDSKVYVHGSSEEVSQFCCGSLVYGIYSGLGVVFDGHQARDSIEM